MPKISYEAPDTVHLKNTITESKKDNESEQSTLRSDIDFALALLGADEQEVEDES